MGTAEFVYNNKVHLSTKISPFKVNYRQDPRIGFKVRKKGKYEGVEKFVIKIREVQKETKAALGKAQKEMKYIDRKRREVNKYKVGDLVMLSIEDLKYQMVKRRTEKLMKRFVDLYKIKKIVSTNAVELELSSAVRIYPVVNVSKIHRYIGQIEGQKKKQPALVIIEGEEK